VRDCLTPVVHYSVTAV